MKPYPVVLLLLLTALCASEERGGGCPALICPTEAQKCEHDRDCLQDEKCCATGCGPVCVKPLYTGCEQLQREAYRRARSLGLEGSKIRIPACNKEGDFNPIQCDSATSKCWCVDQEGFEVPGTRAATQDLVNCTDPKPCAAHTCRMFCPHGFALGDDGCPRCQCHDPCSDIKCPGALSCELENVACLKQPCPPIPRCKRARSLQNVCPVGEPLKITDSQRPFLCGTSPGKPRCPPLFECLVETGNDYGVCCPASFKLQKPGSCPKQGSNQECGMHCEHDLECPSMQKCCACDNDGKHCSQPLNVTTCLQQRMLAELLVMNEHEGKGYVPQCSPVTGQFKARQCSRNGLICWCVDAQGNKLPKSMGPRDTVTCESSMTQGRSRALSCNVNICAQICEYGFKVDPSGCPTCECDNPCAGFQCSPTEQCIAVRDEDCSGFLCTTSPQCQPMCREGFPLMDPLNGAVVQCTAEEAVCPDTHVCTYVPGRGSRVCCPQMLEVDHTELGACPILTSCNNVTLCHVDADCEDNSRCCFSNQCGTVCMRDEDRPPSMCEYLHDFSDKMEGTHEGMKLALPPPKCHLNGSFEATQCAERNGEKQCWCVDSFGSEIPDTRTNGPTDCVALREALGCLDLTCRLGCDYGFVLDPSTRCPLCECRNPCDDIHCPKGQICQMVEANCENEYCPPVPACLPKKSGQCPYLIPVTAGSCDYECRSDLNCNGTAKCCSNGCGTRCVEPVMLTACQHMRAILEHKAHETGIPARQLYLPKCRDEDGSFEPIQCHPVTHQCWCVDDKGDELPGTRAPPDVQPSCEAQSSCPSLKCIPCPHGFLLDESGCQTCKCRDPCAEISCREDGEKCRLVEVSCINTPCPPVPVCLPQPQNPCQMGQPLLVMGSTEVMVCGPNGSPCPSSHKCHLSPLEEYAVCCPKPRNVCFEPMEVGPCHAETLRWYFNSENNKCQQFMYGGCGGNQNNFHSEDMCKTVCPVLSQCERLREKNLKAAEKYKKLTFMPRCDPETGDWESVQCLEHVGVCWCVNRAGEPLKGSVTRDVPPTCNIRQARRRMHEELDFNIEELLKEVVVLNEHMPMKSRCQSLRERMTGTNAVYAVSCDAQGRFLPMQCYPRKSEKFPDCWCVDEAGNQLPNTMTFKRGAKICLPTLVDAVEVQLGFQGQQQDMTSNERLISDVRRATEKLGAKLRNNLIEVKKHSDVTYVTFEIIGSNKVDVAFHLEEMVRANELVVGADALVADITNSRFSHHLSDVSNELDMSDHVIALEHREVVSQSPVSMVTPYQTAIVVLSVASAFVICVLAVVIALYRTKASRNGVHTMKTNGNAQRFLSQTAPIYVVSVPPIGKPETSFPHTGIGKEGAEGS
ncbi:Amyloid beta A4 protein [Cryptotermes secundus]|uniref:Amyloid beta A4 protein n=1 Tax=Cryptotermes secundus TaxID=105785 RepID=A0A2J7R6P9_9NEOP|nr:kielin/chordin-like protein [Cryptotermes secundus]PNF36509.1 Amyloid beta A4 protein [Cryptotermes secundus]